MDLIAYLYLVLRCRVILGDICLGEKYILYIHLLHINKADTLFHVENSEESLTNIEGLLKDSSCEKCFDLETKLHETLKGPSSAQFIVELLRDEYKPSTSVEQDSINSTTSQVRLDQKESDNWKLMTSRHTKGQIRGNIKAKEKDLTLQVNQYPVLTT